MDGAVTNYDGYPVSFGGGVNSVAMVVMLAAEGWRAPIVYAETGTEWPETDAYVAMFNGWLAERYGLSVTLLGPEWRRGKERMPLIDYCEHYRVTPFAGRRWCTSSWKVEPIERWCTERGHDPSDMLIGISAEESRRQPDKVRPLVDRGIDRNGCARIIVDAGLPLPRKSGCYICPFQRASQWRELHSRYPALFERAAMLEDEASLRRGERLSAHPGGGITLRDMATRIDAQPSMVDLAAYDVPCLCRI
jgi:hypothetical protein